MVEKKPGSAQLCSLAGKGYSAFPLPHISPFSLIPHHSVLEHTGPLLLVLSWYLVLPVWRAMATPTSAGSDKGNLPHLSHHSIPERSVSAVQGSPSETPWHVSQADGTVHWKGLCSPCPPLHLLQRCQSPWNCVPWG